jgi:hypothetical protein
MTPGQYVAWAQKTSREKHLSFDGTPERIEAMIRDGQSVYGDLFLDYYITGNKLSRPGLDALIREVTNNSSVTHVFIPRRDRLARPDYPIDAMQIENMLRMCNTTLVFMDKELPPILKGQRMNIGELITALVDYDQAGQFRRDLAAKILPAQIALARVGYSTGGRPPFGFRRWLVKDDGTRVRELEKGESVRMRGHHVVWLPGSEEEISLIRRILELLEHMPASRVAATLTSEGIPSPDAGRYRKDNGVAHKVSGVWHQTTIVSIARNPLLRALCTYGRRSMGDQLRYTPEGPRELNASDYRSDEKPKVIRNPETDVTVAPTDFDPLVDIQKHDRLLAELDRRGGSQRGKRRSRDPDKNPLGCRVFDINCGWPMYRTPYSKTFRYQCGCYMQSHGQRCAHNTVNGPTATRFVLSCLQQRLGSADLRAKLEARVRRIARSDTTETRSGQTETAKRQELATISSNIEKVTQNLALADNPEQYKAMATIFDDLKQRQDKLIAEITAAEATRLQQSQFDLANTAGRAIADRMQLGAAKYDPDDWRDESVVRHVRRAIKHAVTALEIADGDRADDGEDHLQAAVCRMAMALAVREDAVAATDD